MNGCQFVVVASRCRQRREQLTSGIARDPQWRSIPFEGPAVLFTTSDASATRNPGVPGVVLVGTVFPRGGAAMRFDGLEQPTATALTQGSVGRLVAQYWGAYAAIHTVGSALHLFRDPSAAMPCYYAPVAGGIVAGSSLTALLATGLGRRAVAVDHVADCLFRADLPSQHTGLEGIRELLPGHSLRIDGDNISTSACWSPWDHVAIDPAMSFADHAIHLRDTVERSVAAMSSAFPRITAGVSGGLDSSILAACLKRTPSQLFCFTIATEDGDGDERIYARALCRHLGLPLHEARYSLTDIAPDRATRPDLPRPTGRLIAQGYNRAVDRAVATQATTAFFTGNGGDNVFAFSQSAGGLADRLIHEGRSAGAWHTTRDICQLTGCSIFAAASAALRLLARPPGYRWRPDRRFLGPALLAELDRRPLDHPWLEAPAGALPGKAAHIASLLRIQRHLDGTGQLGSVPVVNPLMAQPVVEACLAIPSWMWCHGGHDRAVARAAFRERIPPVITARRGKGGPDGFSALIVDRFRGPIRERLLDGRLAQHGIIDRSALEQQLHEDCPGLGADRVRVMELLEAEAWLDHWQE